MQYGQLSSYGQTKTESWTNVGQGEGKRKIKQTNKEWKYFNSDGRILTVRNEIKVKGCRRPENKS